MLKKETRNERDNKIACLAEALPVEQEALLRLSLVTVEAIHSAVMAGNIGGAGEARETYDAIIWKLNGGTFFGCKASEDSAGRIVERFCQAVPGIIPMWNQIGEFCISVNGVRSLVRYNPSYGKSTINFIFECLDLDGVFISETGYMSHFGSFCKNCEFRTVESVAKSVFAEFLNTHRRYVKTNNLIYLIKTDLPSWTNNLVPPPRRTLSLEEVILPPGFVCVEAVLTPQQAFIVKKWAAAAKTRVEAALKGGQDG